MAVLKSTLIACAITLAISTNTVVVAARGSDAKADDKVQSSWGAGDDSANAGAYKKALNLYQSTLPYLADIKNVTLRE